MISFIHPGQHWCCKSVAKRQFHRFLANPRICCPSAQLDGEMLEEAIKTNAEIIWHSQATGCCCTMFDQSKLMPFGTNLMTYCMYTRVSMEVNNWLVSLFITYLGDVSNLPL